MLMLRALPSTCFAAKQEALKDFRLQFPYYIIHPEDNKHLIQNLYFHSLNKFTISLQVKQTIVCKIK